MEEQFLRDQISKIQAYKTKVNHQKIVRNDANQKYTVLSQITRELKQKNIIESYQTQNEKENLQLELIYKKRSLVQKSSELDFINFEKNQFLKRCERNQQKLSLLKDENMALQKSCLQFQKQKTRIQRQHRQNQILNEKACIESERLRKKCQQMIINTSNQQLQNHEPVILKQVKKIIEENCRIAKALIQTTEKQQNQQQILCNLQNYSLKQRVIELTKQLQTQKAQNLHIGNALKCEQLKYFQLSSKADFLQKYSFIRQALIQKAYNEQYELTRSIQEEVEKQAQLKMKYQQYSNWKSQLEETYGKLSSNYSSYQQGDMRSVRQIGKVSSRFQKNLQQQRHFLKERYSIVDSYRKYLSQHPPL